MIHTIRFASVLAAAKAGTAYESPFIIAGSGLEKAEITGWGQGEDPCTTSPQLTAYPAGAALARADALFTDLRQVGKLELAMLAVANRTLRSLIS